MALQIHWNQVFQVLEVRMIPKLFNNHSSGFVMRELVKKDTSFVLVAHLMPEILYFMFFKMADSGHLGFRGQDES